MTVKLLDHQYEILADETTPILGMTGGYGCGKTYTACRKAMRLSRLNIGFTGIVTEPTFPMLRDIFVPEMKQALDEWKIKYTFNASSYTFVLKFTPDTETKIICMSAENHERLVGINAAWAIMDEFDTSKMDIALKAYQKILGRLRSGNFRQLVITTTPEGFKATHKIFIEDQADNKRLIKAKTTDNKYLPDDFIEQLRTQYPPQLLKAYLEGEFVNLASGTVYNYFNREIHHTNREVEEGDILHIGVDFNIGGCCLGIHVIDEGIPSLVDEHSAYDTQDIVSYLKSNFEDHKIVLYPDASGDSNKTNSSKSDIALLREAGFMLDYPNKNPKVQDRVNTVNNKFYRNEYYVNTHKCPKSTKAYEQQAYDDNGVPEKFGGADTIDDRNDSNGYFIHRKFGLNAGVGKPAGLKFA